MTKRTSSDANARALLAAQLLQGPRLWDVIWPGSLLVASITTQFSTVYTGDAPQRWIVLGSIASGDLLAVPLNQATNKQWFTPGIYKHELRLSGAKDSIAELAHVWCLPGSLLAAASIAPKAQSRLEDAVGRYFNG